MGNISLRAYYRKIESLIEANKNEEAIADCKHILLTYPKNLETYRLLAKAYLETHRYPDALDILQRILSVVPDDFIAHVGMSIIREDEKNLDAAVWHMERAFDVQPSNIAVQDELKRLLGQRDGIEPDKIRLTRGALVRMYLRGNLHTQAIAEARVALKEDPARSDLKVTLARAYNLAGLKSDSIELAHQLLEDLPYCLEAQKILAANPQLAGSEDTNNAHQTLVELDPYYEFISSSMPNIDQIPDNSVLIEELEYQAEGTFTYNTPAIPQAIPETESAETALPAVWTDEEIDSLRISRVEGEETLETAASAVQAQAEDLVPDWMKQAGWQAGETSEPGLPPLVMDENIEEELAPAEIPDWLKSLAPQEETPESEEVGEIFEKLSAELPDLSPQPDNVENEFAPAEPEFIADQAVTLPTDLTLDSEQGEDGIEEVLQEITELAEPQEPVAEEIPEFISFDEESHEIAEASETQVEEIPVTPSEVQPENLEVEETSVIEGLSDDLPDWLKAALSMDDIEAPPSDTPQVPVEETPGWINEEALQAPEELPHEEIAVVEPQVDLAQEVPEAIEEHAVIEETPVPADLEVQEIPIDEAVLPKEEILTGEIHLEEVVESAVPVLDVSESTAEQAPEAEEPEPVAEEEQVEHTEAALTELESVDTEAFEAEESVDQVLRKDLELPDEAISEFLEPAAEDLGEPAPLDLPDWLKGFDETRETAVPDADEFKISELAASFEAQETEEKTEITSPVEVLPFEVGEDVGLVDQYREGTVPVKDSDVPEAELAEQHEPGQEPVEEEIDIEKTLQDAAQNIQNKQNLEETIDTLLKVTEKQPKDIQTWQTLGDAYFKNNQIQQAIDAYAKAESALM